MLIKVKITLVCLFSFSLMLLAQPASKKYTIHDLINIKNPGKTVFSPDGSKAAFVLKKADFIKSSWNSQVYLMDLASGNYSQFTPAGQSCTDPKFSIDGKALYFLSSRKDIKDTLNESDGKQIWYKNITDTFAVKLTSVKNGIEEYTISYDDKTIAILSDEYIAEKEKAEQAKLDLKIDGIEYPEVKPNKVLILFNPVQKQIVGTFILDPGAKEISFSKSGDKILYQTNYTGEFNDEQKFDIYIIDINGKKTQLTSARGPETLPAFSPDDRHIAFITQTIPDIEFAKTELCVTGQDGKELKNLTAKFPYSVESFIWETPVTILALINHELNSSLYRINIAGGEMEKISDHGKNISEVSAIQGGRILYKAETRATVSEFYSDGKQKSNFSAALADFSFGCQSVINYKSSDGKFGLTGLLFYPPNYDSTKKYPLIVSLHGGPFQNYKDVFNQQTYIRMLTQEGYIVFAPNPRGSSGGTDEFGQANRYDLGGGDYRDIMDGVDLLISKGVVDAGKLGVTGGSYGGYLTNWIISQTDRFKAAVSQFGIFSFLTDWSNSWQPAFEPMYFGYNYWERPIDFNNLYISRSPAFYVKNIKTPTLIVQGEKDVYTDVSNSREMYQALRGNNVPVKFIIYPREGHGIKGEPNHYTDVIGRLIEWFNTYIK